MDALLPLRVQWGETDAAGIVYYPNYLRWFDQATHELLRAAGSGMADWIERGEVMPLIECHARFVRPVFYDDELVIHSRVAEFRTRAFRVEHVVRRGDEAVAEGYEVRMWVRLHLGAERPLEPVPFPAELKRLLAAD